jgi:hypothetical protein
LAKWNGADYPLGREGLCRHQLANQSRQMDGASSIFLRPDVCRRRNRSVGFYFRLDTRADAGDDLSHQTRDVALFTDTIVFVIGGQSKQELGCGD